MAKILYTAHARVAGGRRQRPRSHERRRAGGGPSRPPRRWADQAEGQTRRSCSPSGTGRASKAPSPPVARRQRLDAGDATIDSAVSLFPTGDGAFRDRRHARRVAAVGRPRDGRRTCPRSPPGVPLLQRHTRQHPRRPSSQRRADLMFCDGLDAARHRVLRGSGGAFVANPGGSDDQPSHRLRTGYARLRDGRRRRSTAHRRRRHPQHRRRSRPRRCRRDRLLQHR